MDVSFIMAYESGEVTRAQFLRGFGALIRSGAAWTLQGHYGRTARALIDSGELDEDGTVLADVEDFEDEDPDAGEPEPEDEPEDENADADELDEHDWRRGHERAELPDGRHNSYPATDAADALAKLAGMVRNVLTDSQLDTRTPCGDYVRATLATVDSALAATAERDALAKLGALTLAKAREYYLLRDFLRDPQKRYDERNPLADAMARDAMRALMLEAAQSGLLAATAGKDAAR